MPTKKQWAEARLVYETDCGVSQSDLAERLNVTPQAVSKRVNQEGWNKASEDVVDVAKQLPTSQPRQGSALGKRSPENIAKLINAMAVFRNEGLACEGVGIDPKTLYRWKQEDEQLAREIRAARASKLLDCGNTIYDKGARGDVRAAQWVLERSPETREVFGQHHSDKGTQFILNIIRDSVIVEGDCEERAD